MNVAVKINPVKVLLVGQNAMGLSSLSHHLENRGCQCLFAASGPEACRLLSKQSFDLVFCSGGAEGISSLIGSIVGSFTTLFRSHLVEDGCWWLPTVLRGKKCLGAPALRPGELVQTLDQMVAEIKSLREVVQVTAARNLDSMQLARGRK